jgi:hypothetical protein
MNAAASAFAWDGHALEADEVTLFVIAASVASPPLGLLVAAGGQRLVLEKDCIGRFMQAHQDRGILCHDSAQPALDAG